MKSEWMIYGANGYSAQLAAEKAVAQGFKPILAGRNREAVAAVAMRLGLASRIFELSDIKLVVDNLQDVKVVSHCAGPFSSTAEPMMQACIAASTHYTDITGEMDVFDAAQALDGAAQQSGSVLCGGVGFDVIPTDCMAHFLKQALPDATQLAMGFQGNMALSPGTATTMVESLGEGMKVRRNGKIVSVGRGFEMRDIDFGKGTRPASTIPWGDLSTAYWQTGIPDITIYTPYSGGKLGLLLFPLAKSLLKLTVIQNFAKNRIKAKVKGPDQKTRDAGDTYVWGEVKNASGKSVTARIRVPNGYSVTRDGIILSARFLLEYQGPGGYFTPAQLMGGDLVEKLPGATGFQLAA